MARSGCRACCCCCFCPCCFFCGTQRAFLVAGAVAALLAALWLGAAPELLADDVAELCEASMWFRDTKLSYIRASDANLQAYAEVCREAFHSLGAETQQLLRGLVASDSHRTYQVLMDDGIDDRDSVFNDDVRHWRHTGASREAELPRFVDDVKEIPAAFARPEVVRFDATKLLPKEMFNASLERLKEMHPDTSEATTVHGTMSGGGPCQLLLLGPITALYPRIGRTAIFGALRKLAVFLEQRLCSSSLKSLAYYADAPDEFRSLGPSNVNLRRLPQYAGDLNLAKAIGLDDQAERTLSLVWLGVNPDPLGSLHTDVQDNILMELASPTEVTIYPRKLFLNRSQERMEPYFYRVRVEPGQGITIPSNFLHTVKHLEDNRFAINSFFEPQFGKMQWPGAEGNYFYEAASYLKEHLAMRALWFRSVGRLWEQRGVGLSMHGWKMEVL